MNSFGSVPVALMKSKERRDVDVLLSCFNSTDVGVLPVKLGSQDLLGQTGLQAVLPQKRT